jgi:hypothetical protein
VKLAKASYEASSYFRLIFADLIVTIALSGVYYAIELPYEH